MTRKALAGRIVLNIPHSCPVFPYGKECWDGDIDVHIDRWTDWYTDWLFTTDIAGYPAKITPVVFPFSRFFCDVERLIDDPMESMGQGIVYKRFKDCTRTLGSYDEKEIVDTYYDSHISRLKSLLTPSSILIDCHSFPEDLADVDICIGVNDDWSRPSEKTIDRSIEIFSSHGYNTGINEPYSNSVSPKMPFEYPSMMLELNKRIYMDASGRLDRTKAAMVRNAITELYSFLLTP